MIKNLHKTISMVCPINGISIGKQGDKFTWRVDFHDSSTSLQRVAAIKTIADFDVAATIEKERMESMAMMADSDAARADKAIKALRAMSPEQARAWVNSNITSLPEHKELLGTMAAVLCVLARGI